MTSESEYEFYNPCFERNYLLAQLMDDDRKDTLLRSHPITRDMMVALILSVKDEKLINVNLDDWECDLSNVIWPEIYALTAKTPETEC